MKKILTIALCMAAAGSICAQKQVVDQAAKMSGKNDKIGEARTLIQQAMENPETSSDARTYFVAGKIELDAYDNSFKKQMINPNDKDVKPLEMSEQLVNAFNMFTKAFPLDSVPNAKGEIKPKFSKDMASRLNGHFNDFFNAGGVFYNEQKYPQAYEAFMIYGNLPSMSYASKMVKETPDSVINTAFFNAGISAYAANELENSAHAFKQARLHNTDNVQNYVYELACWQYLASQDSTKEDRAKAEIFEIATAGNDKYGISQPLFINNLVNSLVLDNKIDEALAKVTNLINDNPDNAALYGLRGYVNDRKGDDDASVNDYKKAASLPDVDYETLKNAAKKIYRAGAEKWNNIEGASQEQRNQIKTDYFEYAKNVTDKAKEKAAAEGKTGDSDLDYVIENIDYALQTFFN